ncbi:MAG: hypothetical protein HY856_04755 [Burkholderiales bacterium]|nr:hypothetical protein [Burkholderiales bacterium]
MSGTCPFHRIPRPDAKLSRGLAALLALCVAAAPAAPQAPADASTSAPAAEAPVASSGGGLPPPAPLGADDLDIEHGDRLKGLKKVALAGVALYVITEADGGAVSGAALHGGMSHVHASMKVVGLEAGRLQALADRVHALAEASLKARGIEVIPHEALQALPSYAELQGQGDTAPLALDAQGGKGSVFSARGLPLLHMDEQAWLNRTVGGLFGAKVADPYVSLGDKMSVGFRKAKLEPVLQRLAAEAGTPLVMVRVVLSAAQVKTSSGGFSLSASAQTRNALVMPGWTNRLLVRLPDGDGGRVSLRQGRASDAGLGELVDVTTTGAKAVSALTTALTVAAAFYGAGRAVNSSTQALELRTTADHFDAVAGPQIEAMLAGLTQALTP